jgi:hypothetical protein
MSLQDTRNISSANIGSARSRGRGRGRGGGSGRGGRGRGRNIYLGSYSPDQWRKLSSEDKKRVQEGRQKSAEKKAAKQAIKYQLEIVIYPLSLQEC